MPNRLQIKGKRFGTRVVVEFSHINKHGASCWLVRCDCGREDIVSGARFTSGGTRTCQSCKATTHGAYQTPEYITWIAVKQRCTCPTSGAYERYGAKGVKICDRWFNSFENFLEDMGPKPGADYSIDRIDGSGDYTPDNCRWATQIEQHNNKKSNVMLTIEGETKTIAQWARALGVPYKEFYRSMKNHDISNPAEKPR